jgi:hypothetical protein
VAILIGPSIFLFFEILGTPPPSRSTSLDFVDSKWKQILLAIAVDLFILYTWELNFGQTIWDKTEVLLGINRELGET